ncbi:MAG: acetyl-CoA carboxylase biotin carboxylase subunit [Actinomycetota bacterium]|nr:acetyl-CoA carboxylase biotin carboxylase subunit [Actinomycetota bacterium]
MLHKLLVANRGEIAVRVIRAARDLNIPSVAVYSDADASSLHVRLADEAFNIGPPSPAKSYLNIPAIVDAARRSGADSIHPGYGFLAENGDFARAVRAAGMTWVGPPADAIDAMGDKTSARRVAADAGVPTVPGTERTVTSADEARSFARSHGLPVAIKASAGGGGKGFRVVHEDAELEDALAGAAREAQAYFSSPDVYLERYLERPRHVEVQVLGDASGAILTFPERDCSLQRRHQKLIEESPCPALETTVREAILEAAARVSKQVGYRNAGTCEFLLDAATKTFYFLEMNTRLQVEHPVTELVTGIDLVVAQLLIAAGEPLPFRQDDIDLDGHAIECRINAEDAAKSFMPAPGRIGVYREPAGPGVRVDSGFDGGAIISQTYDPMIAKVISHGSTRDEARRRMLRALSEYTIEGIHTTIPFHNLMLSDERFVRGEYHTETIEREVDLTVLSAVRPSTPQPDEAGITLRNFEVEVNGKRVEVRVRERLGAAGRAKKPRPPNKQGSVGGGAGETLQAPMQGTIVKVLVERGQEVRSGDPVCVLEAMKMENSLVSHTNGVVEELNVTAGQAVEAGATIAVIR